jgi:Zn-dependent M28 family amino/carboxypeptidase
VEKRFRAAGLRIAHDRFRVPGHGRSRNVVGIFDAPADCLHVLIAHTDSVPPAPGADDNASGLGILVALAPRLRALRPTCDVWLIATGAEERPYTGAADHLGALAAVPRVQRRANDLRFVLSLDEVGRGTTFHLRSPVARPRPAVEGAVIRAGRGAVRWLRDSGAGNSDHREFALAGLPAAKLGVPDDPCRHTTCDRPGRLQAGTFALVRGVVERLLSQRPSSAVGSGGLR